MSNTTILALLKLLKLIKTDRKSVVDLDSLNFTSVSLLGCPFMPKQSLISSIALGQRRNRNSPQLKSYIVPFIFFFTNHDAIVLTLNKANAGLWLEDVFYTMRFCCFSGLHYCFGLLAGCWPPLLFPASL